MGCTIVIEKGSPPIIQVELKNAFDGTYVNTASVTVILYDSSYNELSGYSWPLAMPYIVNSNGLYRGQIPETVNLEAGTAYRAKFTATDSSLGVPFQWEELVYVTDQLCESVPSSSPSSPAYTPKTDLILLHEAESAYHDLLTGKKARVVVDQDGERVEFVAANRAALIQYIDSLRAKLGLTSASKSTVLGVYF